MNLHMLHEKSLSDQKVCVWCAVARSYIIGPILFKNTINSEPLLALLTEEGRELS